MYLRNFALVVLVALIVCSFVSHGKETSVKRRKRSSDRFPLCGLFHCRHLIEQQQINVCLERFCDLRTLLAEKKKWLDNSQFVDKKWLDNGQFIDKKWLDNSQFVDKKWLDNGQFKDKKWLDNSQFVDKKWLDNGQFIDKKWLDNSQFVDKKWLDNGQYIDKKWLDSTNFIDKRQFDTSNLPEKKWLDNSNFLEKRNQSKNRLNASRTIRKRWLDSTNFLDKRPRVSDFDPRKRLSSIDSGWRPKKWLDDSHYIEERSADKQFKVPVETQRISYTKGRGVKMTRSCGELCQSNPDLSKCEKECDIKKDNATPLPSQPPPSPTPTKKWVDPLNYGLNGKRSPYARLNDCFKEHCAGLGKGQHSTCMRQTCMPMLVNQGDSYQLLEENGSFLS